MITADETMKTSTDTAQCPRCRACHVFARTCKLWSTVDNSEHEYTINLPDSYKCGLCGLVYNPRLFLVGMY